MTYTLDMTPIQASIVAQLEAVTALPVLPDGLPDEDSARIPRDASGDVTPFLIVWFRSMHRAPRGNSFGGTRMDSYRSGFDVMCVASDGTTARETLNAIANDIIGWKPVNAGALTKSRSLFENSRPVLDSNSRPSRFAATDRYEFSPFAKRTA